MRLLPREETIFGIDFSSSSITACLAIKDNKWKVLKTLKIPTKGLSSGVVSSIEIATRDLSSLIRQLEKSTGVSATRCVVGIRGKNINAIRANGKIKISRTDKTITPEDVESVVSMAKDSIHQRDKEVFDFIVEDFGIDDQWGIKSPEGMDADKLEVKTTLFVAHKSHLSNIRKVLNNLDLEIIGTYYSVAVIASQVLSDEEKFIGSLLIDMSDTTTGLIYYYNRSIYSACEVEGGLSNIKIGVTYDLNAPGYEVEKLIREYGYIPIDDSLKSNKIIYMNYSGEKTEVDINHYSYIIRSRTSQILQHLRDRLISATEEFQTTGERISEIKIPYIVISGDICILNGINHIIADVFEESSIRTIAADSIDVETLEDLDPSNIAAILLIPYMEIKSYHVYSYKKGFFGSVLRSLFKWLR
ncbi:MAG: hypothetical protein NZ870_01570 [bacterium]|nr:hypothetical protein [bacterium]